MDLKRLTAAAILPALACTAHAATFVVNKNSDDGSVNTLRWAIQASNAAGGSNTILVVPPHPNWVIMLNSSLPPIQGPAVVRALGAAHEPYTLPASSEPQIRQPVRVSAEYGRPAVVLDGSNFINPTTVNSCPAQNGVGAGPNVRSLLYPALQVVDSGNVDISGFEIRHICIGIMLLRSHDNHLHHNLIHDTVGAAGILVTGDDGSAAGNSTVGLSTRNLMEYNVTYNTGDGMECTRGTSDSVYQYNIMYETRTGVAPYSQGVECAGSGVTGISFLFNRIIGFSDGFMHNSASNVLDRGNIIEGTTYGITDTGGGTNVLIRENLITRNRMGIGVSGNASQATITQNSIYDNGQPLVSLSTSAGGTTDPNSPALLGIDLGINGVTANAAAGNCSAPGPDSAQNYPVLNAATSSWQEGELVLNGSLPACPNASYVVELFANQRLNAAGFAEGELYLGSIAVTTDSTGNASFHFRRSLDDALPRDVRQAWFTATARTAAGGTSEFSAPIVLSGSPGRDDDGDGGRHNDGDARR